MNTNIGRRSLKNDKRGELELSGYLVLGLIVIGLWLAFTSLFGWVVLWLASVFGVGPGTGMGFGFNFFVGFATSLVFGAIGRKTVYRER